MNNNYITKKPSDILTNYLMDNGHQSQKIINLKHFIFNRNIMIDSLKSDLFTINISTIKTNYFITTVTKKKIEIIINDEVEFEEVMGFRKKTEINLKKVIDNFCISNNFTYLYIKENK